MRVTKVKIKFFVKHGCLTVNNYKSKRGGGVY